VRTVVLIVLMFACWPGHRAATPAGFSWPASAAADTAVARDAGTSEARAEAPARDLPGDLVRGARAFGSDLWYVVSSPGRIDRRSAGWLAGVLAVGGVVYAYDAELYEAALRNRDVQPYRALSDLGEALEPVGFMGNTNPFYIAALGVGWALQVDWLTNVPAQILESHAISGGLRNAAKVLIGRRRPFESDDPRDFEFDGGTSFPSGHASVVFEVATILSHHAHSPPVTVLLYTAATGVAVQRVNESAHWPSDVYAAAVSGTLIARTVVRRNEERATLTLAPVGMNGGLGVVGMLRF